MFDSSLKRIDLEIVKFFSLFFLILYGIDPNTFSGGFIALDIIFVLVGFYSTNLILKNYQKIQDEISENLLPTKKSMLKQISDIIDV